MEHIFGMNSLLQYLQSSFYKVTTTVAHENRVNPIQVWRWNVSVAHLEFENLNPRMGIRGPDVWSWCAALHAFVTRSLVCPKFPLQHRRLRIRTKHLTLYTYYIIKSSDNVQE